MNDRSTKDIVDPALSARYRQLADETAGDELGLAVLRTAREAVQADKPKLWRTNWFRSFAFIALVGLSFSLLLQTNDNPLNTMREIDPGSLPDHRFENAAEATAERIRDAKVAAATMQSKPAPAEDSGADFSNSPANTNLPVDSQCNETDRLSSGSWWRCIQSLDARGASAAAETELVALLQSFPGFVAPD